MKISTFTLVSFFAVSLSHGEESLKSIGFTVGAMGQSGYVYKDHCKGKVPYFPARRNPDGSIGRVDTEYKLPKPKPNPAFDLYWRTYRSVQSKWRNDTDPQAMYYPALEASQAVREAYGSASSED